MDNEDRLVVAGALVAIAFFIWLALAGQLPGAN
jgi:hypothetical protein